MALKAVPVLEIPTLDQVPELPSVALPSPRRASPPSFTVIGHRGRGMNSLSSAAVRENSILSFNEAARFPITFVEFDVQVTGDGVPVIFHDVFILTSDIGGCVSERRVSDLSVEEFLSYGSQKQPGRTEKPLLRRAADGTVFEWVVKADDSLCTLDEAFQSVDPRLGFNIELKFDDDRFYQESDLAKTITIILRSVSASAGGRPVIFSTFHPDAARIVRMLQGDYPVFFLTDGGIEIYGDPRRNSLEEAVKLCAKNGLEGIVSEVRAVLRSPAAVAGIKEAELRLLTYGDLNNKAEVVYLQRMMGIDGVIVDRVQEIGEAVSGLVGTTTGGGEGEGRAAGAIFSEGKLSFLGKLIAELVRQ
ncbi:hypothetical protein AXF42_Ash009666 [Apostasia shenzhenica]|uniref:glycerophosphodiester phosphodiesterase n=1 Tax=Apostasia shenzhenica TaxID=1088818 RepID=A0A2I0AWQ9_9ASPA|nr:hypothetical protein AXF42_Ash009666 [Apostasia shenzhenica]